MNETSQSPFWNWKGWQVMKWITGITILVLVLVMIYKENTEGNGWIEKQVEWMISHDKTSM